jgi:putative ergosteryl-3beta-O-L-aspartate hydrolase
MRFFSRRFILLMKAVIWRALMAIGMKFHKFADPKPPSPNFKIAIPSRLSPRGGSFRLVFYVPDSYISAPEGYRFPVVVNFHGGGFTLGTGTDDARWAAAVLHNVEAVFVSVEYRLAPEYPFSVGVEDGTDALIYLAAHSDELRLDPHQIALSGFSAGGNFAFTVPLMLHDLQNDAGKRNLLNTNEQKRRNPLSGSDSRSGSTLSLPQPTTIRSHSSSGSVMKLSDLEPTALEIEQKIPDLTLKALVSFYPPTDFRQTRDAKRATNIKPELNLPPVLADLFDESYLSCATIDVTDPYLSPAAASSALLKAAYPEDIVLYTCEYDMLNKEGVEFGERLAGEGIGKTVHGGVIKGVVHAFDKKPNPLKFPKAADRCYNEACAELRRVFGGRSSIDERAQLNESLGVDRFEDEELLGEGDHLMGKGKRAQKDVAERLDSHYIVEIRPEVDKGLPP